jgi:hypothetical protein
MNDPKNPYSTYWSNKLLSKRYNMEIGVSGFCNGVPIIKLMKKREQDLPILIKSSVELPLNSSPNSRRDNGEIEFNTNKKNFYKARKDIEEGNQIF